MTCPECGHTLPEPGTAPGMGWNEDCETCCQTSGVRMVNGRMVRAEERLAVEFHDPEGLYVVRLFLTMGSPSGKFRLYAAGTDTPPLAQLPATLTHIAAALARRGDVIQPVLLSLVAMAEHTEINQ